MFRQTLGLDEQQGTMFAHAKFVSFLMIRERPTSYLGTKICFVVPSTAERSPH